MAGGGDRLNDQGGRAPRGAGVAAAQPGRGHDRRGQRGADGGGQQVQPTHQQRLRGDLGVPERRALLGAPVHPPLHRVDIDEHHRVGAGQHRGPGGQLDQYPAVHRGQLADVAVVEGPQEAAQRRRGADPADRGRERAVAQQVHPVDGVGAGDHPGHQRTDLQPGVGADLGGHPHMLSGQVFQPDVLGQPHGRYQPGVRHQIRIIKPGVRRGRGMQQSHPRGALSILALRASATRILPGQRALLLLRHASGDNPGGGSRLSRANLRRGEGTVAEHDFREPELPRSPVSFPGEREIRFSSENMRRAGGGSSRLLSIVERRFPRSPVSTCPTHHHAA